MLQFFKKDKYPLGLVTGLLAPVPVYGFFWLIDLILKRIGVWQGLNHPHNLLLLSLVGNLILMRIYFINLKSDKTARGILLITIVYAVLFFVIFYHRV